jgi:pyrimidine operon attenuation protein / uracil phosphoribosyltransferase
MQTRTLTPKTSPPASSASPPAIRENPDGRPIALVGIRSRGDEVAERVLNLLSEDDRELSFGVLDISLYRDDFEHLHENPTLQESDIPFTVDGAHIILVDDVLFTGRTIRAALDALSDYGRPGKVELAVLIDRGHREMPIQPDYVGILSTPAASIMYWSRSKGPTARTKSGSSKKTHEPAAQRKKSPRKSPSSAKPSESPAHPKPLGKSTRARRRRWTPSSPASHEADRGAPPRKPCRRNPRAQSTSERRNVGSSAPLENPVRRHPARKAGRAYRPRAQAVRSLRKSEQAPRPSLLPESPPDSKLPHRHSDERSRKSAAAKCLPR